jgi:hypothetical protein
MSASCLCSTRNGAVLYVRNQLYLSDWGSTMASLFANSQRKELNPALGSVGELKNVIANELRRNGFTDVIDNQAEVAGNRSGVRLSVLHLPIDGRTFWQVVMAGGDTGDVTLGAVNQVVDIIQKLNFL